MSDDRPVSSAPEVLRPDIFAPFNENIVAGFSTRRGGVSKAPFQSLNLGFSTGDDGESVAENRQILFGSLGFAPDQFAVAHQVHGDHVEVVSSPGTFPATDGLVTAVRRIVLCMVAADCAAILLHDPRSSVIGACHAGWRGAAAEIVPNTVAAMCGIGALRHSVRAYISPCISSDNFEVGPEVVRKFPPEFVRVSGQDGDRSFLDLKGVIAGQLVEAGLRKQHIQVDEACTFGDTERFFSHRAEDGKTGRMMGFIALR